MRMHTDDAGFSYDKMMVQKLPCCFRHSFKLELLPKLHPPPSHNKTPFVPLQKRSTLLVEKFPLQDTARTHFPPKRLEFKTSHGHSLKHTKHPRKPKKKKRKKRYQHISVCCQTSMPIKWYQNIKKTVSGHSSFQISVSL
jgi:hypothetical protein